MKRNEQFAFTARVPSSRIAYVVEVAAVAPQQVSRGIAREQTSDLVAAMRALSSSKEEEGRRLSP
jgi:hypothetical protein